MKPKKTINCSECESCDKSIFCHTPDSTLSEVSLNKVMNTYKRGQELFSQGNPAIGIYCISSGRIKVSKIGANGKESIVRLAGPGDILGHSSLTNQELLSTTATVIEDARVCYIDKKFITDKMARRPAIALNLLSKLSEDMELIEARQFSLTHKTARARIADLLIYLSENYSRKEVGRTMLDFKLSREEMASITGTAQETVIRQITEFKQQGILTQEGKTLFIINHKKLAELSQ